MAALRDTITVYNKSFSATQTDRYGNAIESEGVGKTIPARVRPFRLSTEQLNNQDRRTIRYQVVCDASVVLDALTRVVWNGQSYEVDGQPGLLTDRNGPHHYEFVMRLVEGI